MKFQHLTLTLNIFDLWFNKNVWYTVRILIRLCQFIFSVQWTINENDCYNIIDVLFCLQIIKPNKIVKYDKSPVQLMRIIFISSALPKQNSTPKFVFENKHAQRNKIVWVFILTRFNRSLSFVLWLNKNDKNRHINKAIINFYRRL